MPDLADLVENSSVLRRRREEKRLRLAYRNAAQQIPGVHIGEHAHVQMGEDGAFVEATVYIPKEHLPHD